MTTTSAKMRFCLFIWTLLMSGFAFGQSQTREVFMCKAATLRLRATSLGAKSYNWYKNDEMLASTQGSELLVSEEGTYKAFGVNEDGCMSDQSVTILVLYHKPVAVDDIAIGKTNTDLTLDVLKNDQFECAELDAATLTVLQQPVGGNVNVIEGKLIFTPQNNFEGKVSFTYQVTDKAGVASNSATVRLDISATPLPVTLAYFEATKNESVALLDWATSQEANSDHFDIERTQDLKSWQKIGEIAAAVESKATRTYAFADTLPNSGLNYYRLKMVDADETFSYSRVRSVHFPEFSWADVYPNPVDDLLHVIIRNPRVKNLRLISNAGVVFLSQPIRSSSFNINMKQYPLGMFYVHFEQDDGTVKIFKLMHR